MPAVRFEKRQVGRPELLSVKGALWRPVWELAQRLGVHITPVHFYQPVPNTRELPDEIWADNGDPVGLDFRIEQELALLSELTQDFGDEFNDWDFPISNGAFGSVDAEVAYAMIRHFKPQKVMEIGSGYSTLAMLRALERNGSGLITCFDPFPSPRVLEVSNGRLEVCTTPIQKVDVDVFERLGAADIVFIDSSHVLAVGSDVHYEYLKLLPRLPAGVVVHVHDIFWPLEYPQQWVKRLRLFWNEQYIAQAFLTLNPEFEILLCNSYLHVRHPDALKAAVSSYDASRMWPGSLWFRRINGVGRQGALQLKSDAQT